MLIPSMAAVVAYRGDTQSRCIVVNLWKVTAAIWWAISMAGKLPTIYGIILYYWPERCRNGRVLPSDVSLSRLGGTRQLRMIRPLEVRACPDHDQFSSLVPPQALPLYGLVGGFLEWLFSLNPQPHLLALRP